MVSCGVGYGELVPTTMAGRVIACLTMYTGVLLISLPITRKLMAHTNNRMNATYCSYQLPGQFGDDVGMLSTSQQLISRI